jgi:hypothetical protein
VKEVPFDSMLLTECETKVRQKWKQEQYGLEHTATAFATTGRILGVVKVSAPIDGDLPPDVVADVEERSRKVVLMIAQGMLYGKG